MTTFDRVKKLADKQKISILELEMKLGFGKNSLYRWKNSAPASDKLQKVADYFGVSTDYLLGRSDSPKYKADEPKHFTVEEALASVMSSDGKPLTDNDRQILTGIIEAYIKNKNDAK